MELKKALDEAIESSKERNFVQSVDLIINLKNIDLNDPENRFSDNLNLPSPLPGTKVCVIGDTITKKSDKADKEIGSDNLDQYKEDESLLKNLADEYEFFIAEAPLMPEIGKKMGHVLGKMGKMPKPLDPGKDPDGKIEDLKSSIRLRLRESPSIKCKIGKEDMDREDLAGNIERVTNFVEEKLPRGEHNIKDVIIKLTMGPPVKVK